MKCKLKLLTILFLVCCGNITLGGPTIQQPDSTAKKSSLTKGATPYDKLKLADGSEMEVNVQRLSDKFVFFTKPGSSDTDWIDRNEVKAIHYKSGEIDKLDKPQVAAEPSEPKDWQSIELTRKANDIEGLLKVDDIEIRLISPSNRSYQSAKALERSAEVSIMKQAANMNADIVLVTKVNHIRAYGDPPVIIMSAEAYRKR